MKGSKYTRICTTCGAVFDIKVLRNGRASTRKTCSQKCSVANRKKVEPWSEAELDWLFNHIETLPLPRIVRAFAVWGRVNGYPVRTTYAIDHKIRRLGYSTRPEFEFYTFQRLAEMLKIPRDTIAGWKRLVRDPLETYQHDHKRLAFNYVTIKQLQEFARNHPECFGGADEIGLQVLLEDSVWARQILRLHPKRPKPHFQPKRVRCIDTGKVYASLGAAARDIHVVRQGIARAVYQGQRANGLRFELI